jgi:hypothetical protein
VAKWTLAAALIAGSAFGVYVFRGELMHAISGKLKKWNAAIGGDQPDEERAPNPSPVLDGPSTSIRF